MINEKFRKVSYWGTLGATILGVINIIVCFVNGIKILNTELEGDVGRLLVYPVEECFSTILYKISLGMLGLSLLMIMISFLVNTAGALKIIMIICKILQLLCVSIIIVGGVLFQSMPLAKIMASILGVLELVVLLLYIIDSNHRKVFLREMLFTLITVGSGIIYMLLLFTLILFLVIFLGSFFSDTSNQQDEVVDKFGNVIGWIRRH